jgi:hypothetical protein
VMKHGGGLKTEETQVTSESNEPFAYNLCADMLCLAASEFDKKHYKDSLMYFTSAMELQDRDILLQAMSDMNQHTDVGAEAASSDDEGAADEKTEDGGDNDEDNEDDDDMDSSMAEQIAALEVDSDSEDEDDDSNGDPDTEEDDNNEDEETGDDGEPGPDPYGRDEVMSGMDMDAGGDPDLADDGETHDLDMDRLGSGEDDEDPDAELNNGDDETNYDPRVPMNSVSSNRKINSKILANKLSLSGNPSKLKQLTRFKV